MQPTLLILTVLVSLAVQSAAAWWGMLAKPLAYARVSEPCASGISIDTKDSLSLTESVYSSILFTASPTNTSQSNVPIQYQFAGSGKPPEGMIFESYPCNKPGRSTCPQIASSNGIFLDGVPTSPGSYRVSVTATGPDGRTCARLFTVTVKPAHSS